MRLGDHVRPELVSVQLAGDDPQELLAALVALPAAAGQVRDPDSLVGTLVRRERAHSTALGSGVAVPHALCSELDEPLVVVGISPAGVPFGAEDAEPVHIFFLLLSPSGSSADHIKLLARTARLARDARLRSALRSSGSAEEVVEAIRAFESQHI
jgi:mannitol/fructose-specific phosphotransferase system IIA component (Ntr-type)